ncbi:tudor and KH domain-containing protein-like [Tubulanus polymorphus]|uniref:tudor and KH domain-containing protein-like n=1 Tax=Tubulanus polymorphus TaxID=672921 RepID=UPI003DA497C2
MELKIMRRVALLVGLPTLAFCLYMLWANREEDNDECFEEQTITSRQTYIKVEVPCKLVGQIIGRQGENLKRIENESGAKLDFDRDTSSSSNRRENAEKLIRIATIRGKRENAQKAEELLRELIAEQPDIVEEHIHVPQYTIGRIIGRNGETVNGIRQTTKTRLNIEKHSDRRDRNRPVKITIVGSRDNIDLAKVMINDITAEENEMNAQVNASLANRQQRGRSKHLNRSEKAPESTDQLKLTPPGSDYIQLCVTAIVSPDRFWIQMVSLSCEKLDCLVQEMTTLYSVSNTSEALSIESIQVGDIVAAPFQYDDSWYRAEVKSIDDDLLDLYYVDYGDSGDINFKNVRPLRSDFFALPFQAIECRLADVSPADGAAGWTDEAISTFEELSHCAKWKPLMGRTVHYAETESGTSVPCLQLVDTSTTEDVYLAEELITRGLAARIPGTPSKSHTQTTPPSDQMRGYHNSDQTPKVNYHDRLSIHQILDLGKLEP